MPDYRLVAEGVTKTFGDLKANDRVSLHVQRGSVHAVLGENGAGKSTLMNILYGLHQPDEGRIVIDGREVMIANPRAAIGLGIGMVHQHFMLVNPLTVTENVVLGSRGGRITLGLGEHERRLTALSDSFGFEIDPGEVIWKLPIGMQQRIEILKLLYRNVEILILDEPTSVLTPGEIDAFFGVLRRLKRAGKTILFITHKLEEVMTLADRVTVMRDGQVTDELETPETSPSELARLMVGRDVVLDIERPEARAGPVLLEVEGLRARSDRNLEALSDVSFTVREGEILGFAGVDGNGQKELAEVIAGLRPYHAGRIRLDGQDLAGLSVSQRKHQLRIGYVPEDRQVGLVLTQGVALNLVLRNYNRQPFARRGLLNFKAIRGHADRLVEDYGIRVHDVDGEARRLSGGNQQKLVLARELEDGPRLLIVAQPCKGLDVGATEFVQNTLVEQRNRGMAIIYISTELEHIMAVCDRIAVLFKGRISGVLSPEEATAERLGMLMAGVTRGGA